MRAWGWVGGLVGWLGLAGALSAQTEYTTTVRVPLAEVRGGPSEIFPVTGRLRQGERVTVLGEQEGFYAILPPSGSSSWVLDRALKPVAPAAGGRATEAYVQADGAPVHVGSADSVTLLAVEAWRSDGRPQRLKRGTIVRLLGDQSMSDKELWRRIQPTPAEVRYVIRDALNPPQSSTVVTASPGAVPAAGAGAVNPLWAQAEQAERVGDLNRAELLYRQLANQMAQPGGDHDLAIRCYNRIDQLARRRAQYATWPARQPAPGMLVSGSARQAPAAPVAVPPPAAATSGGAMASGPGWLRRTGVLIDGRPAYVLEDDRGQPRYYLLAQSGLNLEYFANRYVEVFGTTVQRPDLSNGYVSVNRLHLLR